MRSPSRVPHLLGLIAMLMGALVLPMATSAQTPTCADYSSTAAAQFALDINPGLAASLDPDGNGVACDDATSSDQTTPSSTELQLPTGAAETPTTAAGQAQPTVDVVDQQPANATTTTTTTQPQAGDLAGRIGGTRASFDAAYGQPVHETASQDTPNTVGVAYASGTDAITEVFVVYVQDQATVIWLTPAQPWTTDVAAGIISDFVPTDVTTLPQPEQLDDGTLLMPVTSQVLAAGITQQAMTSAGLPGAPGDMYLLLTTDGGQLITEVEIGLGNGDNVRAEASGGQATVTTPAPTTAAQLPTPTPAATTAAGTTTDAAFLQQARTEVNQYRSEIIELRTILGKATLTDADTARLSEIVVGWMAIDTTPITAPPEHAGIAEQLTSIHADLSTVGGIVFTVISTGDTTRIAEAAETLDRAEQNLTALDQQLTALGV